ncbi:hypothetical protein CsSME_00030975 [Camellia sinensis var. sinensis]
MLHVITTTVVALTRSRLSEADDSQSIRLLNHRWSDAQASEMLYPPRRRQLQDGLLDNGDFETPPAGGFSNLGLGGRGDEPTAIPSWKTNGTVGTGGGASESRSAEIVSVTLSMVVLKRFACM